MTNDMSTSFNFRMMWKEAVVAYFTALLCDLPEV
jgi:hypothetical protein